MKKRRLRPDLLPLTIEQLKRSFEPFRIMGWGRHVFRYAIQVKPHRVVLTEKYLGEWQIIRCQHTIVQVEAAINNKLAERASNEHRGVDSDTRSGAGESAGRAELCRQDIPRTDGEAV